MRSALAAAANRRAGRQRAPSISPIAPAPSSTDYHPELAIIAASILYTSPVPAPSGRPLYILNAAAFPDAFEVDYDTLLSYVLARLPAEDQLLAGTEYEIIFFAGGPPENATTDKKQGPGMGWYLQAYHVLSRALRKKLQRLYIVHPRTWVRVLIGVFGTVVSPKFRRKIITCNTLSALALHVDVHKLLIPPSTYLHDRKLSSEIDIPYVSGRRSFGAKHPLPKNVESGISRLPRVLRETTTFLLMEPNIRTEGLFRIPAHSLVVSIVKEAYDRGQRYIVWKEPNATYAEPGLGQSFIDEIRIEDAYNVHVAASIVKTWYRELREPLFPETCYEYLRQKFGPADEEITMETLVSVLMVSSDASPLTTTSREVLVRHLLPLLRLIREHEAENKMNAENLAICFCMALVRGRNEMEDAKISVIVKRVLVAAIEFWPQLRPRLNVSAQEFQNELEPPQDHSDYEDPLDEYRKHHRAVDSVDEGYEASHIVMNDADVPGLERAPVLPPRPRPKPAALSCLAPVEVRRRPTPASSVEQSPVDAWPPRYSSMFDQQGQSISLAPTPNIAGPVHGASRPQDRDLSSIDDKLIEISDVSGGGPKSISPSHVVSEVTVPARKSVHLPTEGQQDTAFKPDDRASNAMLAKEAAQKAATGMIHRKPSPAPLIVTAPIVSNLANAAVTSPPGHGVFRKPLLPASATRHQLNIQSLARPVHPARSPTLTPSTQTLSTSLPKVRTPSPGLLARMNSMELHNENGLAPVRPSLEPGKLNLRKTSVDDLRRLYEERGFTVQSLAQAESLRRSSSG